MSFKDVIAGLKKDDKFVERFRAVRGTEQMPIIAQRDWTWQIDTLFFDLRGKPKAIFTALEMTSRKGFAYVMGNTPTASKAVEALNALWDAFPVNGIQADAGSEFKNVQVKKWCEDHDVDLYYTQSGVVQEKGLNERFNKSMRELLLLYVDKMNPNWVAGLDDVLDAYNSRKHSAIDMAPADVPEELMGQMRFLRKLKGKKYIEKLKKFQPGVRVRVWIGADPEKSARELQNMTFRKGGQRWTDKVYVVDEIDGFKVRVVGHSRKISPRDLQIVSSSDVVADPVVAKEKEKQKQVRLLRKEGLNELASDVANEVVMPAIESRRVAVPKTIVKRRVPVKQKTFQGIVVPDKIIDHRGVGETFELKVKYGDDVPVWKNVKDFMKGKKVLPSVFEYILQKNIEERSGV